MEEQGIEEDKINEFLELYESKNIPKDAEFSTLSSVDQLKLQIDEEENWRKKARIAAMIISKNLE